MIKLSTNTVAQFERTIIPMIESAATDSLRAYEQAAQPDGSNYFDNYFLGCACWNNLYNRLDKDLEGDIFFSKRTFRKVMAITCTNEGEDLTFYVSRVDEQSRIPHAGKSIKLTLQNQLFLSQEIQDIVTRRTSTIFVLGYDIDIDRGLGKITLDMLFTTGKNKFQSLTVHTFESAAEKLPFPNRTPAQIPTPSVTRTNLPSVEKSSSK